MELTLEKLKRDDLCVDFDLHTEDGRVTIGSLTITDNQGRKDLFPLDSEIEVWGAKFVIFDIAEDDDSLAIFYYGSLIR